LADVTDLRIGKQFLLVLWKEDTTLNTFCAQLRCCAEGHLRGSSSKKTTQLEYQVAKMAISEMAMMLKDNIPMIKQYSGTLFNIYFICDFGEPF